MEKITSRLFMWLFFFSLLIAAGCQSTTGFYLGARADDETIVSLGTEVQEKLHWQDLYVKLDYTVQRQAQILLFAGDFSFADYPQGSLVRVVDFKLKLFLLDENQLVVDYFEIYRSLGGRLDEEMKFSKTLSLPAGTAAFAFGYEGRFVDEEGARETAWKLPKKSF